MKSYAAIILVGLCSAALAADRETPVEDSISVEVIGTLRTGIVAIGGETTGTTITSKGITWELQLNERLRNVAEDFNGKQVLVRGDLERKAGVEIRDRWIVIVSELKSPESHSRNADKTQFEATVGRADSRIQFMALKGDAVVIDVKSEFGIDRATIHRGKRRWPREVLLRLHLRGLESLRVASGERSVEWSVSSTRDSAVRVTLHEGAKESPVGEESPYFSELKIVADDKQIPLKDGYFEVALPNSLFAEDAPEIKLSWVDFYRQ